MEVTARSLSFFTLAGCSFFLREVGTLLFVRVGERTKNGAVQYYCVRNLVIVGL